MFSSSLLPSIFGLPFIVQPYTTRQHSIKNSQNRRNVLPHDEDLETLAEAKHPDSDHSCTFPSQDDERYGMFGEVSILGQKIDEHLDNFNRLVLPLDAIHHPKE
jgi:hypothetical protein